MTTAARPTWSAAKASANQGGGRFIAPSQQVSAKLMPGHLVLKTRQAGQNTENEVSQRDLKAELLAKENKHFAGKNSTGGFKKTEDEAPIVEDVVVVPDRQRLEQLKQADKDDDLFSGSEDDENNNNSSDDDDDDDDDDEAELMRELERIKQERAAENARKEEEARKVEEEERQKEMLRGNPLLNQDTFAVKRRWDDDVVFKNQARGDIQPKKRFINDTIRNDFHRKFLAKYIH